MPTTILFSWAFSIHSVIEVEWSGLWFQGTIDDKRVTLDGRNKMLVEYHVSYDDGENHWHLPQHWNARAMLSSAASTSTDTSVTCHARRRT